jgi:Bacterial Ig domain
VRRLLVGLGIGALAIVGIALILWTNSAPPPKVSPPPAPAPQASLPAPPPMPTPPAAPAPAAPSFDIVKVDPSGHAVVAGRAAPGARVAVLDGGKKIGEVTADNRGEWVLVPTAPMIPGERQLTLEATDPASGAKTQSSDTVALAVAPTSTGAAGSGQASGSGTVAVLLPGNASLPACRSTPPNTMTRAN